MHSVLEGGSVSGSLQHLRDNIDTPDSIINVSSADGIYVSLLRWVAQRLAGKKKSQSGSRG